MNLITLDFTDLAIASLLVVINGALSVALQLGLARQLLITTARMIVQLLQVGLVLATLIALVSALWTGLAAAAMVLFAGYEIMARQERRLKGTWAYGLGTACMLVAASVVTSSRCPSSSSPSPGTIRAMPCRYWA